REHARSSLTRLFCFGTQLTVRFSYQTSEIVFHHTRALWHKTMSSFTAKFRYKQDGDAANFDKVFAHNGKHPYYAHSPPFFSDQDSRAKFCTVLEVSDSAGEPQLQNVYLQFASEMFYGEDFYVP